MASTFGHSDAEKRFRRAVVAHGGPFRSESAPAWISSELRGLRDRYHQNLRTSGDRMGDPETRLVLESVYLDYVNNFQPNAVILQDDGGPLMGIFVGLPLTLLEAISLSLLHPANVPLSVEDLRSTAPPPGDGLRFSDWLRRQDFRDEPPPLSAALVDCERRPLAQAAFGLLMDFVFEHEMSHLMQGHVELAHRDQQAQLWMEQASAGGPMPLPTWRQCAEIDADSTAVRHVLERQFRDPDASSPFGGEGTMLRLWLLGLSLLFQILDAHPAPFPTSSRSGYPHPCIRLMNLIQVTAGAVKRFAPELEGDFNTALMVAVDDSRRVASHLGLAESMFESVSKHQSEARRISGELHRGIDVLETQLCVARANFSDRLKARLSFDPGA